MEYSGGTGLERLLELCWSLPNHCDNSSCEGGSTRGGLVYIILYVEPRS